MWRCKEPPIGSSWIEKKNQCHVPWKTIVLPAPSQALLISLIIARRLGQAGKVINLIMEFIMHESRRESGGGGVLEFDIKKILKIKFYLEIEGMFVDSYAY